MPTDYINSSALLRCGGPNVLWKFWCPISIRAKKAASQSRVNRFALHRQNAEDAFVHAAQWFGTHEAFQCLHTECKFAQSKGTFGTQAAKTQALKALGHLVF